MGSEYLRTPKTNNPSEEFEMDSPFYAFLPFLMFLPFFVFLIVFAQQKRNCPDCGQPLSGAQSLRTVTWRQWFEGGFLCRNCGCETTLAGDRAAPGTGPRTSSVIRGVLLLTLTAGLAPVLLFYGISQSAVAPTALVATPPIVVDAPPFVAAPPIVQPDR